MTFATMVFAPLTVFVSQPLLALAPAALFAVLYRASNRRLAARGRRGRIDGMRWSAAFLFSLVLTPVSADPIAAQRAPIDGLEIFKGWLDRVHPGYGRDEGPARFRNPTVEAAYPGRRFYYVLTYTRGTPPPFRNGVTVVAGIDDNGAVTPLDPASAASYRPGLRKVSTAIDARRAAAAVLILVMGDPGERRWQFREKLFTVKKENNGWVCNYRHGAERYTSQVTFDRNGVLTAIRSNTPPVP
jgi:hypothetical protein